MSSTILTSIASAATTALKITFENAGSASLGAGVATFGQVFLPGQLPSGAGLVAQFGQTAGFVQIEVKSRYADGSVKMAVLAVERPALVAGATVDITLSKVASPATAAPIDLAAASLAHAFTVEVNIQGGANLQLDVLAALRQGITNGTASFWENGALASQARVEIDLPGSQRMIFDVTAFKGGGLSIEAQFNNDEAMQATGGRVNYSLKATLDGKQVVNETINQGQYQNWHASFASNATDGGQGLGDPQAGWLNIRHDIDHLQATGAVAQYDLGLKIDPGLLAVLGSAAQAPGWSAPLATNGVTQNMGQAGGRGDIGFTTLGNTTWLISQDSRAADYALGQAQASTSVPWHFWDAQNKTWLNTDAYPRLWTDYRGGTGTPGDPNSGGLTQQVDAQTGWSYATSHQPSLSYVPYLLTGQRWLLDGVQAQAAWNVVTQWPLVRGDADDNLVNQNQVRGAAWGLRQVDEAAFSSPDGSAEKAYFQSVSNANYQWLVAQIPKWTAEQGEAHGWVPGVYGSRGALPPWQQDYFASTVIAAASRGNADALTFLNWQSNFLVGRFTNEARGFESRDGAAYLIAISDPTTDIPYKTWAEIGAQMVARGWTNGDTTWSKTQGDYGQLALATLSAIAQLTGSAEARAAYDALLAEAPPFTSSAAFARDPLYAISAPGGGGAFVPPPASSPPPPPPAPPLPEGGQEALSIKLGAESWGGNPIAVVLVNGNEVFRGEISIQHAQGGQLLQLGNFAQGVAHTVTVRFTNDAWGGSAETDRNLWVEEVFAAGAPLGFRELLTRTGEVSFVVPAALTPQPNSLPTLSVSALAADQAEGNSGSSAFTFLVTRSGDVSSASTAAWAVVNPAMAGDFVGGVLPSGVVRFAAGETTKTISVAVSGDTVVEANEAFTLVLSAPTGASLQTSTASGTIRNDDALFRVSAGGAVTEGNSGATPVSITITRSGDTTSAVSASWAATGSGANPATASDFVGNVMPSGLVSFAVGETTKVIQVNLAGDTVVEANESFSITLSSPSSGVILGAAPNPVTIVNDDAQLSVAGPAASIGEGQSGTTAFAFTVTRIGDTSGAASAKWSVAGTGPAPANAADFAGGILPSGTVTFLAGETTKLINANVAGDSLVEANEGFTMTLSSPSAGATLGVASASAIIRNDDAAAAATMSIAALEASVTEGASGLTPFTFTVTRAGDVSGASSASWAVAPAGTAKANAADFVGGVLPKGVVSFAPGQTSQVLTINVAGDVAIESNETFKVTLTAPVGAKLGTTTAIATIINDDPFAAFINGTMGNDRLIGDAGPNQIFGFSGNDRISGGAGADTIDGGAGVDVLAGNSGNDVFLFTRGQAAGDTIVDFNGNGALIGDRLVFSGFETDSSFVQVSANVWQVLDADGMPMEAINFTNGATVHFSDWSFI